MCFYEKVCSEMSLCRSVRVQFDLKFKDSKKNVLSIMLLFLVGSYYLNDLVEVINLHMENAKYICTTYVTLQYV